MRWIRRLSVPAVLVTAFFYGTMAWCQTQEIQKQVQTDLQVLRKSAENLKQIGLAMHNYHDAYKRFPAAAIYDKNGKALLSWRVAILPFLEDKPGPLVPPGTPQTLQYEALYKQFKIDEPWDSDHNKKLLDKMPKVYKSPTTLGKSGRNNQTFYQVLTGPDTVFVGNQGRRITAITDGTSNTILAIEAGEAVPWTKPADVAYDAKKPLPRFGGISKAGFNILLCDGSTRLVRPEFNERILRDAITPSGGELIDLNQLHR
jgi:hypothetical protein